MSYFEYNHPMYAGYEATNEAREPTKEEIQTLKKLINTNKLSRRKRRALSALISLYEDKPLIGLQQIWLPKKLTEQERSAIAVLRDWCEQN